MNLNQPTYTLSKKHFEAYNQILDDYKNLSLFENEMEAQSKNKSSEEYLKAKNQVKKILSRIIENKSVLGWNYEYEQTDLKQLI